jgi:hypothetical protein
MTSKKGGEGGGRGRRRNEEEEKGMREGGREGGGRRIREGKRGGEKGSWKKEEEKKEEKKKEEKREEEKKEEEERRCTCSPTQLRSFFGRGPGRYFWRGARRRLRIALARCPTRAAAYFDKSAQPKLRLFFCKKPDQNKPLLFFSSRAAFFCREVDL